MSKQATNGTPEANHMASISGNNHSSFKVFLIFLRLGLTSFGGPIAHLSYFRDEFVSRRGWLTDKNYADLIALCQFLPGPGSSQVGMAIGLSRSGYSGALAAWAGFTLPSAIILIILAIGITKYASTLPSEVLQGLKVVAVAVVAQAVWGMAKTLCQGVSRTTIMTISTCFIVMSSSIWAQVGTIVVAGLVGLWLFKPSQQTTYEPLTITIGQRAGIIYLVLFFLLLIALPLLTTLMPGTTLATIDAFFRAGSLVFGGGHVVLPLLQAETVGSGWVNNDMFLAGYGAAQAVPGPLFTFAGFLGAANNSFSSAWIGGTVCLLAIFAPSFLLVAGTLPFWEQLRTNMKAQAALAGINAAVVGLLLAALYHPVWTSAIYTPKDFALALAALTALMCWKWPPWLVVITSGSIGGLIGTIL